MSDITEFSLVKHNKTKKKKTRTVLKRFNAVDVMTNGGDWGRREDGGGGGGGVRPTLSQIQKIRTRPGYTGFKRRLDKASFRSYCTSTMQR